MREKQGRLAPLPKKERLGKLVEGSNPADAYEDLSELSSKIFSRVQPAVKDIQEELVDYLPKEPQIRKTYAQDWAVYYQACSREKLAFLKILTDAVDSLEVDQKYCGNGRPPAFYKDIIKNLCVKAYNEYSLWRMDSELRIAKAMGVIDTVYKRSTLCKYANQPVIKDYLHELYKAIAEPLVEVDVVFAADSTGISDSYGKKHWVEVRLEHQKHKGWRKLHIMTGVRTNVITAAIITEGHCGDSPYFEGLLKETAKHFDVQEVSADAAYLSRKNVEAVANTGGLAYIMPKKNVKAYSRGDRSGAWNRMIWLWRKHQLTFAQHYHQRSNVESTFGMMKRKWGHFCRNKLPVAQEVEILTKVVCHNAAVLSEALLAYEISPKFMQNAQSPSLLHKGL